MQIGDYQINKKNVAAFIQGNVRNLKEKLGDDFFKNPPHIREQVIWRMSRANPDCINSGKCVACKCDTPALFYADKGCERNPNPCYPAMMNKELWEVFKNEGEIKMEEIEKVETHLGLPVEISPSTFEFGEIEEGEVIDCEFEFKNICDETIIITNVRTDCGCTTPTYKKEPIPSNESTTLKVSFNSRARLGIIKKGFTVYYTKFPQDPKGSRAYTRRALFDGKVTPKK